MIKISKNDNIFDVLYKIQKHKNSNKNKIILEFPFWHPILHNYLSLKSIVEKFPNKKIIIITTDLSSKKIGKKLWIKYSLIKNIDFIENKDKNNNLIKYNYTFFEYFKYEINKFINFIKNRLYKSKNINTFQQKFYKYKKQKSNIFIFIILLTLVSLIFLYIFFFALNKTTVYITPEIEVQTKTKNFIFNSKVNPNYQKNNEIKVNKIATHTTINLNYKTTWIKQENKYKATTNVNFINNFNTEIKLLPHTRLLTSSWILFETTSWVRIPPAIKNNNNELIPWIKTAQIIAKTFDSKWIFIGTRANNKTSSWLILTLPWLKENQDKLYAKTISPITWWKDIYTHVVSKTDIKNALSILKDKLIKKSIKELNNKINNENKINNVTFKVLDIDNIFNFKNINTQIIKKVEIWQKLKSFNLIWSLDASTYIYNVDKVISKLQNIINEYIIPWKEKILSINNKSIRISNIIFRQDNPLYIKASVEIEYFIEYNFENNNDNYIKRLKNTIAWLSKEQAEKILINENKISNAKIEIRPFFLNKVSSFFNNINFVIEN